MKNGDAGIFPVYYSRRKFRVHGRKSVVSQNIMISVVLMDPGFSHLCIPYTSIILRTIYNVEGTQYKICWVSKHNYR